MKFYSKLLTLFLFSLVLVSSCQYEGEEDFLDGDYEDCSEFCDYFVNNTNSSEGSFDSQGDCMSLCNTCNNPSSSIGTTAVCGCNWIQARIAETGETWSEYSDGEFNNKGQCIKAMKARLNNN